MPNNPRGGGVSRRIEGEERNELRDPWPARCAQGMSVIARTAGIGRSAEELQWDLNYLLQLWRAIERRRPAAERRLPDLPGIQPGDPRHPRLLPPGHRRNPDRHREHLRAGRAVHGHVMPGNVNRVKLYKDDVPLFSRFQIEHQIETAYSRAGQSALRRRHRHRPHRGAGGDRRQLGARDQAAPTSRKPRSAPTWRRPTKSPASCGCATWAA
jgi:ribonuclease E